MSNIYKTLAGTLILGAFIGGYFWYRSVPREVVVVNQGIGETPRLSLKEEKTTVTIVSVGDIFLHDTNIAAAYNATTKTYNFDSVFSAVSDYFSKADLTTAWLGGVLSTTGPYAGYPLFTSPSALAETLHSIGINAVFRTNHTMDAGTQGLNMTTQILEQNNIAQVAAADTEGKSQKIFIYQKDNLKVAYLGYIYGMNGLPIPKPWMVNLIDHEKIKNDIVRAKQQADFVIVALHFGNEYERLANAWQKETVQKIADAGADMIIGSHVHVIQPVDVVTSADGRKVYVAYGLGNFYCDQRTRYTDAGVILQYVIEKTGTTTELKDISFIPTLITRYKVDGRTTFQVLPAKKYIELYQQGKASFLTEANVALLRQAYHDTVEHLSNPAIKFMETEEE